jgi:hypothetical protein
MRATVVGMVMCGIAASAVAQDFNVDVGPVGSLPPSSSYAGAGQSGLWNSVTAEHTPPFTPGPTAQDVKLVDIDGNLTAVGFHQFGGMNNYLKVDPALAGEDATLLNDYLATHSLSLATCPYLNGLANGTYEVITYAWMPKSPVTLQRVNFDFHPGQTLVGGSWTGSHTEGVTYSRDIVEVTSGAIGWHIAIPPGQPTEPGAAFNGFQIRRLTWEDLGGGAPGVAGTPAFTASGSLVPNSTLTLDLTQAAPNAPMLLWLSFSSAPLAVLGGTVYPLPPQRQFLVFSDAAGAFSVSAPWPPGVPTGTEMWLQFLIEDSSVPAGITPSNAVKASTP